MFAGFSDVHTEFFNEIMNNENCDLDLTTYDELNSFSGSPDVSSRFRISRGFVFLAVKSFIMTI